MKLKTLEQEVKPILEEYEDTRADDMRLYVKYISIKGLNVGKSLLNRKYRITNGLAPYDSVSRVRRKLQAANESLRPSKKYMEQRKKAEAEYKKYAKEKGAVK